MLGWGQVKRIPHNTFWLLHNDAQCISDNYQFNFYYIYLIKVPGVGKKESYNFCNVCYGHLNFIMRVSLSCFKIFFLDLYSQFYRRNHNLQRRNHNLQMRNHNLQRRCELVISMLRFSTEHLKWSSNSMCLRIQNKKYYCRLHFPPTF